MQVPYTDVQAVIKNPKHTDSISAETKSQYRDLLRSYRQDESQDPIANRRPWHCELAVLELMAFARLKQQAREAPNDPVEVRILTASCPNHVYGRAAIEPIEAFLSDGGIVKVLVWNEQIDAENNSLLRLKKRFPNLLWKISGTKNLGDALQHFFVVGSWAYRLEAPHKPFTGTEFNDLKPEIPARICFNDPSGAEQMIRFFDDIWKVCKDVE